MIAISNYALIRIALLIIHIFLISKIGNMILIFDFIIRTLIAVFMFGVSNLIVVFVNLIISIIDL